MPTDLPAEIVTAIQQSFRNGMIAAQTNDATLQPALENVGPEATGCLWDYFHMGFAASIAMRPAPHTQEHQPPAPKVAAPEPFDGTRHKYTAYITQLHLVFNSDPARYGTESSRISYAASYLAGTARDWFQPHVNQTTGAVDFPTFALFVQALKAAFDDPDARATAERKLLTLRQNNRDCSSYHAEFVTLATTLELDERTRISFFRRGLAKQVQTALAYQQTPPETFNEFVQLCITLDNNLRALGVVSTTAPPTTTRAPAAAPTRTTATGTQSGPMDLSAGRRRGPLTEAERNHRRANNLCLYCGKAGHFASVCPARRTPRNASSADAAPPAPEPAAEGTVLYAPPADPAKN